ncbi:ras-like protein family member 10B [Homalodisca vitripennis]|uniref:ras-like protein family member 10B n=1 Tax=Homalodisca vitripennis TaxID=197043 RepID=UPI001EE9B579|nr:ras-like protein family member 10B [Homalodisca vitripennis]
MKNLNYTGVTTLVTIVRDVSCSPCSPVSLSLNSPDAPELVKVVLLGAPGVGKTSIIQQFVWNNFVQEYLPTGSRHTYYPTVIINGRVYELKITDLPALPYFPVNSVYELTDLQDYGLRDASAYMMVLDLSNLETFQYLENVREQIAESRDIDAVPLLVVGNKIDLFDNEDDECLAQRRALMDRIKAVWGCGYAECSARYSSLVCQVFRQMMLAVDQREMSSATHACPSLLANFNDALGGSKCSIL